MPLSFFCSWTDFATRYTYDGVGNMLTSTTGGQTTTYTYDDERVYESSRIVGAYKDEEYNG